jgi:hypothetical protein
MLVDLECLPIERFRAAFDADGILAIPGFVTEEGLRAMRAEVPELVPLAHWSTSTANAYLTRADPTLPMDDPRSRPGRATVGVVAYDCFPVDSTLRRLYEWPPFIDFLAAVLGVDELHPYADPFGALNLAVMRTGDELSWHFDFADFVVSLALGSSTDGGHFEYVPRLRVEGDERYDEVADVLAGRRDDRVRRAAMTPGTLLLFRGRHSLHRVTPVAGSGERLVALLSYDTRPGADSTDELKLARYGRLPGTPPIVSANGVR